MKKLNLVVLILSVALLSLVIFQIQLFSSPDSTITSLAKLQIIDEPPTGYDPLTEEEQQLVLSNALQAEKNVKANAANVDNFEVLLIERHEVSKAERADGKWQRQGDLYLYDYATDTLIHSTVDVQSGAVVATERVQGVQLPLTQREEDRSLALVQSDTELWSALAERYRAITGEVLNDLSQLQVKVSLFHGDSMPNRVNAAAQSCGQHRCAQVLIFTVDKTLLDVTPIVDLSQGKVVQVMDENNAR